VLLLAFLGRFPAHHQSHYHVHGGNGVPDVEDNESDPSDASQLFKFPSQCLNPACPMRILEIVVAW
jgi:hypothetical protein